MQGSARRSWWMKAFLTVAGGLLVMIGLVGIALPVMPGFVFLIPGLAILAGEYHWARRLLDRARPMRPARPADTSADDLAA